MARLILAIDQTASRASYGLKNQQQLLSDTVAEQRRAIRENIAAIVANGNRKANISSGENAIAAIAAEEYLAQPQKEIAVQPIERPAFHPAEITGGMIDIFI